MVGFTVILNVRLHFVQDGRNSHHGCCEYRWDQADLENAADK